MTNLVPNLIANLTPNLMLKKLKLFNLMFKMLTSMKLLQIPPLDTSLMNLNLHLTTNLNLPNV